MKTAIIGAGITGLSCAYRLKQSRQEFLVFEKRKRVGGVIHTEEKEGHLVEHGPNSLLLTDLDIKEYLENLGLSDEMIEANPASSNRYILREGELAPLPTSPLSFLTTKVFSLAGKIRLFREFFISPLNGGEDHSLASFFKQRFGKEIYTYAVDPFIAGIYAGDPEKLSVRHAFPTLHQLEQTYGSVLRGFVKAGKAKKQNPHSIPRKLVSFRKGMGMLPNALYEKVRPENVRLKVSLNSIEPLPEGKWRITWQEGEGEPQEDIFQRLVLTNPAYILPDLPFPQPLLEQLTPLEEIHYPPIACVAFGFRRDQIKHALDGFGMLIPSVEDKNLLGTIFSSTLFPDRAPSGQVMLQCFVGGARNSIVRRLSREDIVSLILPELSKILGIQVAPSFTEVRKWKKSIPQLNLGHERFLGILNDIEKQYPTLTFAGNYRNGVSVPNCIHAGWAAAQAPMA